MSDALSPNITPNITLSPKALARVSALIYEEENPNLQLRIYITGGGCAGFQYGFMFDEKQRPDDTVVAFNSDALETPVEVKIAVDPLSLNYLEGAEVDYIESLQGSHFKINNPNAQTTCSCGASFSLDTE